MFDKAGNFRSALAGVVVGALLVTAVPVLADAGDDMKVGRFNDSGGYVTRLKGKGKPTLRLINWNGNPALELRVSGGVAPLSVNSGGRVDTLNVDELDGFDANDLVRVAHAETTDVNETEVFGGGQAGDLLSTQMYAPTAGFLFIVAGVDSYVNNIPDGDGYGCSLNVDGASVPGSGRNVIVDLPAADVNHSSNAEEDCSSNGVQKVGPGLHRVDLHVDSRGGALDQGVAWFRSASLQVLFVPFKANGSQPNP